MLCSLLFAALVMAPAEKPFAGAVIAVDPGHGGQAYSRSYTGGTRGVGTTLTESELNLRIGLALADILREQGATVFITRDADHRLSPEGSSNVAELHARVDFFEHHNCHFFLSVHHNAGAPAATGHTALYKHNASDDTLYESLARDVNDALSDAVPGPKLKLIKGSYHILRETDIPGTISEAGFMTNVAFDKLASTREFPKSEAAAIAKGAAKYWAAHKPALEKLRAELAAKRVNNPTDPKTYTNTDLNPATRERNAKLLAEVAPQGDYRASNAADYVRELKAIIAADPKAKFDVSAKIEGGKVVLSGEADRASFNRLIDMLVAMRILEIENRVKLPAEKK